MKTSPVLTPQRESIVHLLRQAPGLSTRTIATSLGVDDATAAYHLHRLEKAGVVLRRRQGRAWAHHLTGVSP